MLSFILFFSQKAPSTVQQTLLDLSFFKRHSLKARTRHVDRGLIMAVYIGIMNTCGVQSCPTSKTFSHDKLVMDDFASRGRHLASMLFIPHYQEWKQTVVWAWRQINCLWYSSQWQFALPVRNIGRVIRHWIMHAPRNHWSLTSLRTAYQANVLYFLQWMLRWDFPLYFTTTSHGCVRAASQKPLS